MAEIIGNTYKIDGNLLTITLDNEVENNSKYEIRFKNLKSKDGKAVVNNLTYNVITELSPSYCRVSDVAILVDTFNIPESTILYYIREASNYVDYIKSASTTSSLAGTSTEVTFPMKEFVKTKVMIDCLTQAYVAKAAGSGIKGKLGEISFENTEKYATSIDDLLDSLWKRLKGWEDSLRGFEFEGRVGPKAALKANKASAMLTASQIASDISRDLSVVEIDIKQ
jgi:hypothetical protein